MSIYSDNEEDAVARSEQEDSDATEIDETVEDGLLSLGNPKGTTTELYYVRPDKSCVVGGKFSCVQFDYDFSNWSNPPSVVAAALHVPNNDINVKKTIKSFAFDVRIACMIRMMMLNNILYFSCLLEFPRSSHTMCPRKYWALFPVWCAAR